jgi:hypothetical protein
MTNNELLPEVIAELHAAQSMILALVQMLSDNRVLKGGDEKILEELGRRVDDIQFEGMCKAWLNVRTRELQEQFDRILAKRRIQ